MSPSVQGPDGLSHGAMGDLGLQPELRQGTCLVGHHLSFEWEQRWLLGCDGHVGQQRPLHVWAPTVPGLHGSYVET